MMTWVWLTLLCAFFDSGVHLLSKKNVEKAGGYLTSASLCFVAGVICLIWALSSDFPSLDLSFYALAAIVSFIGSLGMICYMQGLENSEVSYAIPLLCFGPILTALWSWIFFDETITIMGLFGVMIVLVGTYLLEMHRAVEGFFTPIKAIFYNQGARLMFAASLFWSVSSVLDKIGVFKSTPVVWICVVSFMMTPILLAFGYYAKKITRIQIANAAWSSLSLLGICYALAIVFQMFAFKLTSISYVLSLKRCSLIISVLVGSLFFKEQQLKERLLATIIMIIGGIIIILYA